MKAPQIHQDGTEAHTVIECRKTTAGASTRVIRHSPGVTVFQYGFSRSRSTWKESIFFGAEKSAWVEIQDVSNSGKHSCFILKLDGTTFPSCVSNQGPLHNESCMAVGTSSVKYRYPVQRA